MLEAAIRWTARALDANEPLIREMVHRKANWALKLADAMSQDRATFTDPERLAQLANDLQTRPETRERVEAIKEQLLDNRSVGLWLDTLWQKSRETIIKAARNPDAVLAGKLGEVLKSMGGTLEKDARIRGAINQFARRATVGMAASYGGSIVSLVSDTIRGWDARTVTNRLEAAVGRDLQYIRINGTIVGGLVGLALRVVDTF